MQDEQEGEEGVRGTEEGISIQNGMEDPTPLSKEEEEEHEEDHQDEPFLPKEQQHEPNKALKESTLTNSTTAMETAQQRPNGGSRRRSTHFFAGRQMSFYRCVYVCVCVLKSKGMLVMIQL